MELHGDYTFDPKNKSYKFTVRRIVVWKSYRGILKAVGLHFEDKTNEDVDNVTFTNLAIGSFPRHLSDVFPNLKAVAVNGCGLKKISKEDLKGLHQLNQLSLNGNQIEVLPDNLFEATPNIEVVSLYGNKIRLIGASTFGKLKMLKYANLKMNSTIDVCLKEGFNEVTLQQFNAIINAQCQPDKECMIESYFRKLKTFDSFMAAISD